MFCSRYTTYTVVLIVMMGFGCTFSEPIVEYVSPSSQDSLHIAGLLKHWRVAYYQGPDSIRAVAVELINFSKEKKNRLGLVSGNNMMAMYHSKIGDDEKALEIYSKNLETNQGDLKGRAKIYNNIGNCYLRKGDYDLALEAQFSGLKAEEELENMEGIATSYLNIAGIYAHLSEDNEVISYANKAYEISSSLDLDMVKMQVAFQLAEVFAKQRKDSLALLYSDTTIACATRLNSSFGKFKAKTIQAKVYTSRNRIKQALAVIQEIGDYYAKTNFESEYLNNKNIEAELLIKLGEYAASEVISTKNLDLAMRLQEKEQIARVYKNLSMVQDRLNKVETAYSNFKKYHVYQDSIINMEKNKSIEDVAVKYETEKKEDKIASLSQQAEIQSLEIRQKNLAIVIGLVSFLLLALVGYFAYQQRIARSKRSQIEIEQRFLRSQLNPHFIFNALVAIQNFMLKNSAEAAVRYLSKFAKLMREILENSRREFIPVENEIEMLTNYMDIHKLRLNDSFDYSIVIDESIDPGTDTIPPMFVQPFIENAIEHGIISADSKGLIELNFIKDDEYISIEIKDNGGGLAQSADTPEDHTSLATTIIKERMALFNKSLKKKIQLVLDEIKNEQGEILGTKVELKVPFSYI